MEWFNKAKVNLGGFKDFLTSLNSFFNRYFIRKRKDIVILDDFLPSVLSPWRSYEFNEILREFPDSVVFSDLSSYYYFNSNKSFSENLETLGNFYPSLKNRVYKLKFFNFINHKIGYVLFYNNLVKYFDFFISNNLDFFFTLYPGGGFQLNDEKIDLSLKRICSNPLFKGVIVNQHVLKRYLIEKNICSAEKICLIHGVPFNLETLEAQVHNHKDFSGSLKILFMANKYTQYGMDKGFPVFVEFAKLVLELDKLVKFHVVGNFKETDITNQELLPYFKFHGQLQETEFGKVLNYTHLVISPNAPFILSPSGFDGFPLGSSITAGFYNNAMFLTDYFNESTAEGWIDNCHFVRISPDSLDIFKKFIPYYNDREKLSSLAFNGKLKILDHFSKERQISPRIKLFKDLLN